MVGSDYTAPPGLVYPALVFVGLHSDGCKGLDSQFALCGPGTVAVISTTTLKEFAADHPDAADELMLSYLMEQRGLKRSDLTPVFGSKGYASDVIGGRRAISKAMARKLGEFFRISPDLFL